MADKEIRISVVVDSDGAVKSLKELDQGTERAGDTAKRSSEGFSKLQASIVTINQAVSLARSVFSGFQSITSTLFDTLNQSTVIEGLSRSFDNLQASIGVLGDQKIASLQNATKGLIADFDLMQQANQAVLLGVDKGTGEFEELAGAALKLGAATGRTATEALGDLITGLGRASPLILDNLGITVKAAEAQQLYADKLGKAVKDLTEAEKAEAFRAVAIDKIRQKSLELADVQETAGTAAQRLETSLENLFADVATGISENEDLRDAINDLSKTINETDFKPLIDGLSDFIALAADATAWIARLVGQYETLQFGARIDKDSLSIRAFGEDAVNAFNNAEIAFRQFSEPTERNLGLVEGAIETLRKEISEYADTQSFSTGAAIEAGEVFVGLQKRLEEFKKKVQEANKPVKELGNNLAGSSGNGGGGATKGAEEFAKAIDKIKESIDKVVGFDAAPGLTAAIQGINDGLNAGVITTDEARGALNNLLVSWAQNEEGAKEFARSLELIQDESDDTKEDLTDLEKALEGLDFAGKLADSFDGALGGGGDLFSGILTGKGGFGGLFDELTGQEGGLLGGLLGASSGTAGLIAAAVAALGSGLKAAFDVLDDEALEYLTGDERGKAFYKAFEQGVLGTFGLGFLEDRKTSDIDEPFEDLFGFSPDAIKQTLNDFQKAFGVFGSNDPGTLERESIDKFFQQLFDGERLSLVIAGELEDVTDLTVSEYTGFFDTLNTATEEGLNQFRGFEGIGLALNEILGLEAVGDEQIGAILGNNLETLNNLQIFLGKAKISADQLGEALEEAFLNGDITAKQFLTSSAQIENIYTQGIPDGVGLTQKAFENLLESAGQGRLALDALGDLGVEAIEKGITSLEDLRQDLLDSGADADEVAKLFDAIAQSGITSLEELQNISLEKVAQIVQILEDSGIDLGLGDAQAELDDIQEKLNNLPERVRTSVEIDVSTNFRDRASQDIYESGALGPGLTNQ